MRIFLCFLIAIAFSIPNYAQSLQKEKIKLFLDCNNTWCDMNFIRQEIPIVDYVLDYKLADVHLLITTQRNGSGGQQYQMIYFGQNNFSSLKDTLHYSTEANNTDFENRALLVKYIKLGLVPYILKTDAAKGLDLSFPNKKESAENTETATVDKWNYWVYSIGVNGNTNGEKTYRGLRYNGNLSARRVTDDLKLIFNIEAGKNKSTYIINDPTSATPSYNIINNNQELEFAHQLIKSINPHWSYGYLIGIENNTYSNYKFKGVFSPAIEYNLFPYIVSTNKLLTFRYNMDVSRNVYIDSTIYARDRETLYGQGFAINLSLAQKWGSSFFGLRYHNYFGNNLKYFSLGLNGNVNVRITGGLSFNVGFFGGLTRDQLNLSGKDVSQQDILLRRRQLASNYNYYTYFGINYRFGSSLNNFVNPRFNGF